MSSSTSEYGRIPEFFSGRCQELGLPLETVRTHTRDFIDTLLRLEQLMDRINMHRYLDPAIGGTSQLHDYLRASGVTPEEAGRIANAVLAGVQEAGVPLHWRQTK